MSKKVFDFSSLEKKEENFENISKTKICQIKILDDDYAIIKKIVAKEIMKGKVSTTFSTIIRDYLLKFKEENLDIPNYGENLPQRRSGVRTGLGSKAIKTGSILPIELYNWFLNYLHHRFINDPEFTNIKFFGEFTEYIKKNYK